MWTFILLILCIDLDSFVLMMEKGAVLANLKAKEISKYSLVFALVNSSMLLFGNVISKFILTDNLVQFNQWLSNVILVIIGIGLFVRTLKKEEFKEQLDMNFNIKKNLTLAVLSSIDSLLLGLSLFYLHIPFLFQALITFGITFIIIFIAMLVGYYRGASHQKKICYFSSFVYFAVAFFRFLTILYG